MIVYISYCQGKQDLNYVYIDRNTLKLEKLALWDNLENSSQTLYKKKSYMTDSSENQNLWKVNSFNERSLHYS